MIVLVTPPLLYEEELRLSFQPPLNLLYLYSFLRERSIAVTLLDQLSLEKAIEQISLIAPEFIGIPLYYASLPATCSLVSRLREKLPGTIFVAGGPCLTMEPERMMREGNFDFGVIGEGEETLLELLSAHTAGKSCESIQGLAIKKNDSILITPPRQPMASLDSLPFLDFSAIDSDIYFAGQKKAGVPQTLFMNSSRGCSFRCVYCCTPTLWPGKIRRYSPRRLIAEVKYQLTRFPESDIGFCDDSFFSDQEWLNEIIELIRPLKINFQCIGRADHLTPEIIHRLVDAGMNYIAFGVETGNATRQARLRKNLDLSILIQNMKELSNLQVKTKCFFMLGFPDETLEEMTETINLAAELKRNGMTFFSIFPVTVYPGTELAREFPHESFTGGLDVHLPEIIRDNLAINENNIVLLESRFNSYLTQRQMVELITFAWQKVAKGETVAPGDLERVIHKS